MVRRIIKRILVGGLIFFAVMIWRVVYLEVREIRLDNALEEYYQAFTERDALNVSNLKKIEELSMKAKRGTTPAENAEISQQRSQIINDINTADEKLAKAKQKFCDLAGEEEPLCRKKQEPIPQGWPI